MNILIVDNYDSFTYNLLHTVREIVTDSDWIDVVRNDRIKFAELDRYQKIILSPGPGIPKEAGGLLELIDRVKGKIPVFGVCLGFQAIAELFGAKLFNSEQVFHGVVSEIDVCDDSYIFDGLPRNISVGRYHSWFVSTEDFPECLKITARDEQGQIMALSHRVLDLHGVQFHPESFLTPDGRKMLNNFINR